MPTFDLPAFIARLADPEPPRGITPALDALWWAGKGDWDRAHKIVMANEDDAGAAWVHAYLHRAEGDIPNANYWYRKAKRSPATGPLETEWQGLVASLIEEAAA